MDTSLESRIPEDQSIIQTRMINLKMFGSHVVSAPEIDPAAPVLQHHGILDRISRYLKVQFHRWIFIPDDKIGWLPFAVWRGATSIRRYNVDAILTTSSPLTAHLIGYFLKKVTGKPWVADFRDRWTKKYYHNFLYDSHLRLKIDTYLERLVINNADHIINAFVDISHNDLAFLESTTADRDRIHIILNGFERKIYETVKYQQHDRLTFCYTGTFYGENQLPKPFFKVLSRLVQDNIIPKDRIAVRIISDDYHIVNSYVNKVGLKDIVHCVGWVPHQQAIQEQVNASVLLLILPNNCDNNIRVPGKLFEYMGVQRPILALIPPDGIAAEIIRYTQIGSVVCFDDEVAIRETLIQLYKAYCELGDIPYSPIAEKVQLFERRNQVLQVGRILTNSLSAQTPLQTIS